MPEIEPNQDSEITMKPTTSIEIMGCGQGIYSLHDWASQGLPISRRDLHWKEGRSAFELGRSWTGPGGCVVPEQVRNLLNSHEDLGGVDLLMGFIEHETKLPFGDRGPRCHDLMVKAVRGYDLVTICIEAKADETFGGTVRAELEQAIAASRKRPSGTTRFPERLDWLTRLLFGTSVFASKDRGALDPMFSKLFYQLFTAIGGTLLEAKHQRAGLAILIFHEFRTSETDDRKLRRNANALDSFLRVFLDTNGRGGENLADGKMLGPIWVNPKVADLGVEMPVGVPLYIGKIRTDLV